MAFRPFRRRIADNGLQYLARLLEKLCPHLKLMNITTTAYYLQSGGQVKRYEKTLVVSLGHYISDHQKNETNI